MCGICGFISKNEIKREQLREMNDTMYHRGPDDSGEELYSARNGYCVGMAQRRLSILDLSSMGHQPMATEEGRIIIVFNGEIYNYQELKGELKGYPFCSACDTEVILAAYRKWGIRCVEKLNGMFAFAIYDRGKEEIYLCRDRIGKKPLYFWHEAGQLVFGSEMKPIMKALAYVGGERRINKKILGRYLYQKYILAPDTIFEKVNQVEPGAVVRVVLSEENGGELRLESRKYWDVKKIYHQQKGRGPSDFEEAKVELRRLLERAVQQRMIADVPLGSFLSGGYDSSLITAIAQSVAGKPVKTFCIGFDDKQYNEALYAKEIAGYLGTNHTELYIDEKDMFRLVESIPKYYDEPFADSSQISTMLVSELAKKDVTVVLSGDGGDEFFCGYNIYERVRQAQSLDVFGALAHRLGKIAGIEKHYPFKVRVISQNRNPQTKTQLSEGNYKRMAETLVDMSEALPCDYDWESMYGEADWQERRMLLDMETYLPGDILCKVDRASMKYSLETRCPILDKDVMEFAFSIPHSFKYENGMKKRILKELAYEYIPKEMLDRRKTGFGVPLDKWLRGPLKQMLLDYTEKGFLERQGLFRTDAVFNFVRQYLKNGDAGTGSGENYSRMAWAVLVFQQWYTYYM